MRMIALLLMLALAGCVTTPCTMDEWIVRSDCP